MHKIFKEHVNLKECFETADGQVFYTENAAQNHAKTLEKRSITKHVREDELSAPETPQEKTITQMNKTELLDKAKELGVEANEEMTKKEIIALIEDAINPLPLNDEGDEDEEQPNS